MLPRVCSVFDEGWRPRLVGVGVCVSACVAVACLASAVGLFLLVAFLLTAAGVDGGTCASFPISANADKREIKGDDVA
jgi:hypothetical protein